MKYCLIVTQYYHTYCMNVVKIDERFIVRAYAFTIELMKSRGNEKVNLGDLAYYDANKLHSRYNVNDEGDIYFINAYYFNALIGDIEEYKLKAYKNSRQYVKKAIIEDCSIHNDKRKIHELVKKHFEIV